MFKRFRMNRKFQKGVVTVEYVMLGGFLAVVVAGAVTALGIALNGGIGAITAALP